MRETIAERLTRQQLRDGFPWDSKTEKSENQTKSGEPKRLQKCPLSDAQCRLMHVVVAEVISVHQNHFIKLRMPDGSISDGYCEDLVDIGAKVACQIWVEGRKKIIRILGAVTVPEEI